MSPLTLRQQLRPSRSVTSHPQRPGLSVAHASVTFCNTRHRLSLSFGHAKPNGLTLPARRPVVLNGSKLRLSPLACAPGAQKLQEKLLTFKRHTADFHTTKHEPLRFGIPLNIHSANKNIVAQTSTVVFDTTVQMSCVTKETGREHDQALQARKPSVLQR